MAIMDKKHRTLGYLPMPNIDPLGWSIRQITYFQTIDTNLSIGNLHLFFIEHITVIILAINYVVDGRDDLGHLHIIVMN